MIPASYFSKGIYERYWGIGTDAELIKRAERQRQLARKGRWSRLFASLRRTLVGPVLHAAKREHRWTAEAGRRAVEENC